MACPSPCSLPLFLSGFPLLLSKQLFGVESVLSHTRDNLPTLRQERNNRPELFFLTSFNKEKEKYFWSGSLGFNSAEIEFSGGTKVSPINILCIRVIVKHFQSKIGNIFKDL